MKRTCWICNSKYNHEDLGESPFCPHKNKNVDNKIAKLELQLSIAKQALLDVYNLKIHPADTKNILESIEKVES